MAHPFLEASIPELVAKLSVKEKISLLSGPNWWNTNAIPRLGIPSVRMSDGPNGVRGSSHFVQTPAQCFPSATALASTFDPDIIHQAGVYLAQEAKAKSSVVLLAPTCNIQRTPLGGRVFECFSEDPHLSGVLAAAYISGLQSEGVAATIKHFVGNDQEHERTAAESVMTDRTLREIYLYPFMLAQKLAQPSALMTAYGRIKGVHCSENKFLLEDILRREWGFKGLIISDWFGTYGTDQPINAGLDLEMPGPPRWRTSTLILHCLSSQKLLHSTIDDRVSNLLVFLQKQARRNPEVVFGDGVERSSQSPVLRKFCRRLAAEGIVLLKNRDKMLPLSDQSASTIAVIGPNVKGQIISGGGSAALKPTYVVTPWQGIKEALHDNSTVHYHVGCYAHKYLPTLETFLKTPAGDPGWRCTFFTHDANGNMDKPLESFTLTDTRVKLNDFLPDGLSNTWSIKLEGQLSVTSTGIYELGLTVAGRAKLYVNGELTIDNWTKQTPGDFFYGQGTIEEKAAVHLSAEQSANILVVYTNTNPPDGQDSNAEGRLSQPALMKGVRLGGCPKIDEQQEIENAASLAKIVDSVIVVVGLGPEWESEGFDRPSLHLPGRQDELIQKISSVNPNTLVCIQAGSPIEMPWLGSVAAVLQTWYLGNELGHAIADVIFGACNPSGRLPLTFPHHIEDTPAFLDSHSENGKIHYREHLFVGYKHYQARNIVPLFPFGYGISYTEFGLSELMVSASADTSDANSVQVEVVVQVRNVGSFTGSQVVQLYTKLPEIGLSTPQLQLKSFAKTPQIHAGSSVDLRLVLDKYAFSFWDEVKGNWKIPAGVHTIYVGTNSADLPLNGNVEFPRFLTWSGL
ncbi:glycoside hydrolase family 3 protein [Crepidotus variabilis]|uniref:beta-glucosidase n=1 Tax=Crepidotus variabilis TaxID=179855 RepID=A0A9P6EQZ3_9AGAR|nr:glycoside hydrolase family 3 protein [Crepidotus variabilis]